MRKNMSDNIFTKKAKKSGEIQYMVRFQYKLVPYPVKNFTKLYRCKSFEECELQLRKVKDLIDKGINPFITSSEIVHEHWTDFVQNKITLKEWKESSRTNYVKFYTKWVKPKIGKIKAENVTRLHANQIIKSMNHLSYRSRILVKSVMQELFSNLEANNYVQENVWSYVKIKAEKREEKKLTNITNNTSIQIIRKIFKAIPHYEPKRVKYQTEEIRAIFYSLLFTAHRVSELLSLEKRHTHLKLNKFISTPDITKTSEHYHFPIPPVIKQYVEDTLKKQNGLFPNLHREVVRVRWKELLAMSGIEFLNDNYLTPHDTRRLMMHVMIKDCKIDSRIVDACLNHKQQGTIKAYIEITYDMVEEAYQKFWAVINSEEIEPTKIESTQSEPISKSSKIENMDRLIKYADMLERGLITQDEFFEFKKELVE